MRCDQSDWVSELWRTHVPHFSQQAISLIRHDVDDGRGDDRLAHGEPLDAVSNGLEGRGDDLVLTRIGSRRDVAAHLAADHDSALHLVGLRGLLIEARPGDVIDAALVAERLGPQLVGPVRRIGSVVATARHSSLSRASSAVALR